MVKAEDENENEHERRKQTSIFKDPRIDRAITWGIGALATAGVGLVLNYSKTIEAKLDAYGTTMSKLREDIAVLQDERREIADLKMLVSKLEERLHSVELRK